MAKEQKTVKIRKKRWFKIYGPKMFGEPEIGEVPTYEANTLRGRTLEINLMDMTGDPKAQNTKLTFAVETVEGDNAYAIPVKYQIIPATIKRLVRRTKDKVDASFLCKTKDQKLVRFKPLLITKNKTTKSVQTALRKTAHAYLQDAVHKLTYEDLILQLVNHKLQRSLKDLTSKVFPLKVCEIRIVQYEGEAPASDAAPQEPVTKPAEETGSEHASTEEKDEISEQESEASVNPSKEKPTERKTSKTVVEDVEEEAEE
ncbi:hypothetical protein HYW21_08950 [Candidatus Woesearchaeota archaeon]|nr:hypothetical protein [Candidatus Woesearchaeota archaeon]